MPEALWLVARSKIPEVGGNLPEEADHSDSAGPAQVLLVAENLARQDWTERGLAPEYRRPNCPRGVVPEQFSGSRLQARLSCVLRNPVRI